MSNATKSKQQARYWILTIPESTWSSPEDLPSWATYIAGQLEVAPTTGYRHWQVLVCLIKKTTLTGIKKLFPRESHCEAAQSSEAAREYVLKKETSVPGTQFNFGEFSLRRNSRVDWSVVLENGKKGLYYEIPPDILIRYYNTFKRLRVDYSDPIMRGPQEVHLYWGDTGTGKTRKFFDEIGDTKFYLKAPTTKWWDGYQGQEYILVDEFRGLIEVSHLLKWLDRYPCASEVKGAQVFLNTKKWVFTSNLSVDQWYPDLDVESKAALKRRFTTIVHFSKDTPKPFTPGWKGKEKAKED